jgi:uncharacterized protein (TIGR02145 family)
MKNKITTLILVMLCSLASMAQVGIGTNSPNANAALDVVSTTQGILLPRMTATQRNAISSPAEGLTIFNTTTNAMQTNISTTSTANWKDWNKNGQLGSTYTAYYTSGTTGDIFSNNTTCQSKLISAQGCGGLTSVTGASGTNYNLVNINGQCWMTTNLNEVPSAYSTASGGSGSSAAWRTNSPGNVGYWGYYNTTATSGASGWATTVPAAGEGLLYQWSAAMNGSTTERAQGVCPTGFHIPSDCEWMYLEHGQGMSISQQTTNGAWRSSTGEGNKLRSAGTGATNSSGFTALLAGYRSTSGTFRLRGTFGLWWSSSEASASNAQDRGLYSGQAGVRRYSSHKAAGYSVRCLKD